MTRNTSEELILEALRDTDGNISKVARVLGVDYHALKTRYGDHAVSDFRSAQGPEPEDIRTLGRRGFEQFVVAVKPRGSEWPDKYDGAIEDARRKFDAGTHEMFQTNDDGWVVQYSIPHLVPVERRQFFSSMVRF